VEVHGSRCSRGGLRRARPRRRSTRRRFRQGGGALSRQAGLDLSADAGAPPGVTIELMRSARQRHGEHAVGHIERSGPRGRPSRSHSGRQAGQADRRPGSGPSHPIRRGPTRGRWGPQPSFWSSSSAGRPAAGRCHDADRQHAPRSRRGDDRRPRQLGPMQARRADGNGEGAEATVASLSGQPAPSSTRPPRVGGTTRQSGPPPGAGTARATAGRPPAGAPPARERSAPQQHERRPAATA
jgi:hypothetical protein